MIQYDPEPLSVRLIRGVMRLAAAAKRLKPSFGQRPAPLLTGQIGALLDGTSQQGAVQIAITPVFAARQLSPGEPVDLIGERFIQSACGNGVGIVDPFLRATVPAGARCWLFLYPLGVTAAAPPPALAEDACASSRAWLQAFVLHHSPLWTDAETAVADFIAAAQQPTLTEPGNGWLVVNCVAQDGDLPPEFWRHIEVVTGSTIPADRRVPSFLGLERGKIVAMEEVEPLLGANSAVQIADRSEDAAQALQALLVFARERERCFKNSADARSAAGSYSMEGLYGMAMATQFMGDVIEGVIQRMTAR